MLYKTGTGYGLGGPIDSAVTDAVFGGEPKLKGPPTAKQLARQKFFAEVVSKGGQKFVASAEGKKTVNKVLVLAAIPAFASGLLVGYLFFRKRG